VEKSRIGGRGNMTTHEATRRGTRKICLWKRGRKSHTCVTPHEKWGGGGGGNKRPRKQHSPRVQKGTSGEDQRLGKGLGEREHIDRDVHARQRRVHTQVARAKKKKEGHKPHERQISQATLIWWQRIIIKKKIAHEIGRQSS